MQNYQTKAKTANTKGTREFRQLVKFLVKKTQIELFRFFVTSLHSVRDEQKYFSPRVVFKYLSANI